MPSLADVTIIPGRTSVRQRYEALLTAAIEEVLVFDRPPYSWAVGAPNSVVLAAARRVSIRVLHQRSQAEDDDAGAWRREVAAYQSAGVVARVADDVPRKLVVVDRTVALASLMDPAVASPSYPVTVLVEDPAFAAAEADLFESLWAGGLPLPR